MSGSVPALWRLSLTVSATVRTSKRCMQSVENFENCLSARGWWRTFEVVKLCVIVNLEMSVILIAFNGVPYDCLSSFQRFIVIDLVVFDTISVVI